MTPQQYQAIAQEQEAIIEEARMKIAAARREAESCPVPENLRPATAEDVVLGAVIWKPKWEGKRKWSIVEDVGCPDDAWKAWTDDGCRYGLHEAFVENDQAHGAAGGENQPQTH